MRITRLIATSAMLLLCLAPPLAAADPAEDVYRSARRALTDEEFDRAAKQFADAAHITENITLKADAMYWAAFSLYKMDDLEALYESAYVLEDLMREFPEQALAGDAGSLATRVEGELARRGDARYAERLARTAERMERYAEQMEYERSQRDHEHQHGDQHGDQERAERDQERAQRESERAQRGGVPVVAPRPGQSPGVPDVRDPARVPDVAVAPEAADIDQSMKIAALNALINADPKRAVPILQKLLANPDRNGYELRKKAVFLVAQHHTTETEDILLSVVKNDPNVEVRADAVFWLSQVPGDKSLEALEHILRDSKEPELQEKAVFALSQHPSLRTGKILRDLAVDKDASFHVREQAIFWLSQNAGKDTFEFLSDLYRSLDSRKLKDKVIFAMSQLGDRRTTDWMLGVARDVNEHHELRKQALFWMSQGGHVNGKELMGLYRSLDDREMKEQLIFVLSQMPCEESIETLVEVARRDEDEKLREKAVFWIGQSRCEGAMQFLEELIGN